MAKRSDYPAYREYWQWRGVAEKRRVLTEARRKGVKILSAISMQHLKDFITEYLPDVDWKTIIDVTLTYDENIKLIKERYGVVPPAWVKAERESQEEKWDAEQREFEREYIFTEASPEERREWFERQLSEWEIEKMRLEMETSKLKDELKRLKKPKEERPPPPPVKVEPEEKILYEVEELGRRFETSLKDVEKTISAIGEVVRELSERQRKIEEEVRKPPPEVVEIPPYEISPVDTTTTITRDSEELGATVEALARELYNKTVAELTEKEAEEVYTRAAEEVERAGKLVPRQLDVEARLLMLRDRLGRSVFPETREYWELPPEKRKDFYPEWDTPEYRIWKGLRDGDFFRSDLREVGFMSWWIDAALKRGEEIARKYTITNL